MEIIRQPLGSGDKGEFRSRQLSARRMLNNELEGADLEAYVEERLLTTTLDKAANWARGNAFMPATFGLACCAIEMMAAVNARMDIARFGFEAFRASPAPGRPDDHLRPREHQDGPGRPPRLRPDARAQVGHRDGRLLLQHRRLQQLRDRAGRQVHAGGRAHPGLPAATRGARLRILKLRSMVMAKPDLGWRTRYGGGGTEEFDPAELEEAAAALNVTAPTGRTSNSA